MVKGRYDDDSGTFRLYDEASSPLAEPNEFLAALHTRGLSPHTLRAYGYDLVTLYRWLTNENKSLKQLRARDLISFIDAQRQTNASAQTINRRLSTCYLVYRYWTGEEFVGTRISLPAAHYRGPGRDRNLGLHQLTRKTRRKLRVKTPHTIVEPLNAEQVRGFLHSLRRYRDLAIVYLMLFCGLRSQEVLELRQEHLSFEDHRLRILGKGQRERMLPIPTFVLDAVGRYLQIERPETCHHAVLFVVLQGPRRGARMTPAGLRSLFRHRRKLPELKNANAHRFRHTFGADMARAGIRLPVLQKMMGHADGKTTLQYIQLSMADIADEYRRAMKKIQQRYDSS